MRAPDHGDRLTCWGAADFTDLDVALATGPPVNTDDLIQHLEDGPPPATRDEDGYAIDPWSMDQDDLVRLQAYEELDRRKAEARNAPHVLPSVRHRPPVSRRAGNRRQRRPGPSTSTRRRVTSRGSPTRPARPDDDDSSDVVEAAA